MSVPEDVLRSLPVPISGTHATGEASVVARQEAARVLYFARLLANSAGVPVWQLQRPLAQGDGSVKAQVAGPLALKKVHQEPVQSPEEEKKVLPPADMVRLVWLPEGFVITPRSKDAPNGWGMPPTKNADGSQGLGTPDGPLRQVIINRFKNNQYPDALFLQEVKKHGASEKDIQAIEEARKKGTLRICAANLLFQDWELLDEGFGIGLHVPDPAAKNNANRPWAKKKMVWRAQFKQRFKPEFSEQETDTWFCHRPQHAFESGLQQYLRAQTNIIRAEVNMPPLHPPVRGTEGQLSESPIYMMEYSGVMGHDSYEFREGHQSFIERVRRVADGAGHGENVYVQGSRLADVTVANASIMAWKNSPLHYANMIRDWTFKEESIFWPSLDSTVRYLGDKAAVTKRQNPPYSLQSVYTALIPEIKPAVGSCQIFNGSHAWMTMHNPILQKIFVSAPELGGEGVWDHIEYKGRLIRFTNKPFNRKFNTLLAFTEIKENNNIEKLRIAIKVVDEEKEKIDVVLLESHLYNDAWEAVEIGRFNIGWDLAHIVTMPVFSESGNKMAFMYSTVIKISDSPFPWHHSYKGQTLHFVEWEDGIFKNKGEEKVMIEPMDLDDPASPSGKKVWIKHQINTSYRLFPVYNGDALDYITYHVNNGFDITLEIISAKDGKNEKGKSKGTFNYFSKMQWPNGDEFVCYDVKSFIDNTNPDIESIQPYGFVRAIMIFDIKTPENIAYTQYDIKFNAEDTEAHVFIGNKKIKDKITPFKGTEGVNGMNTDEWFYNHSAFYGFTYPSLCPVNINVAANSDSGFCFPGKFWDVSNLFFSNEYPAVLFGKQLTGYLYSKPDELLALSVADIQECMAEKERGAILRFNYIGPIFAESESFDNAPLYFYGFFYYSYKDEWIHAGKLACPLGFDKNNWQGDDRFYYASSLDLKKITGISDLSDNILPIGVIEGVMK